MKRFGMVILVLSAFAVGSILFTQASWADGIYESRIYMGMNIPAEKYDFPVEGVKTGCRNADTGNVYGEVDLPGGGLTAVTEDEFGYFLTWIGTTYGGEENPDFGYTVFNTTGYYQGETEYSRVILLFFAEETAGAIADKYRKAFCQDSVYVNTVKYESTKYAAQ